MYQLDWSKPPPQADWPGAAFEPSRVNPADIEAVYLLEWQEHCIECAIPHCYKICPLYARRGDGQCARFEYGIYPNRAVRGLHPFGADIRFRRWGKLEAQLTNRIVRPITARAAQRINRSIIGMLHAVSSIVAPGRDRKPVQWYAGFRRRFLPRSGVNGTAPRIDDLLIELYSPETAPFRLIVETFLDRALFRTALEVKPGRNLFRIPVGALNVNLSDVTSRIYLYPENDAQVRMIFTWLDLVRWRVGATPPVSTDQPAPTPAAERKKPAAKVKCVVWDLDNTLWDGILADDGPEGVKLRAHARELIKQLDERGILQSVASKNSHETAWKVIEKLGLQDYFLYPAISWGPKSHAMSAIAEKLNINIDTLALIDDSAIERAQVSDVHSQVRCYADTEIIKLLSLAEFDVPISDESRKRRLSYLTEAAREQVAAAFSGDQDQFLRSCELVADVFFPTEPAQVKRCLELLLRSNQLNLSTRRYSETELRDLLADSQKMCVAIACHDRFGDYGSVGFLAVDLGTGDSPPMLRDFVMSCRVAKKKVENAVLRWLCDRLGAQGAMKLLASYLPTERNGVLLEALTEVGFTEERRDGETRILSIACAQEIPGSSIVKVEQRADQWPLHSADAIQAQR